MFPFLHQGHWTRITEPVGGMLLYKPPIQDINAQDLYIPLMAFGTYVVIASYALGVLGRSLYIQNNFVCSVLRVGRYGMNSVGGPEHRGCYAPLISARTLKFTPMSLTLQFTKGLLGWFLRVILIRVLLYSLESGEASLLDVVAYAGYRLLVHHL